MKKIFSIFATLSVLAVSGCVTHNRPNTEDDTAAINEVLAMYVSSLEAGDNSAYLSLWTEDGIQMPPNWPPVIGKDQIRLGNKALLDQFNVEMEITVEENRVADSWAFSHGTYTATLSPKNGDQPVPIDGKFMTILEKQSDGSWKIHRDISNSNASPGGE